MQSHTGQRGLHVRWQGDLKMQGFRTKGVHKSQAKSMQGLALYVRAARTTVQTICQQGQTDGGHVNPDLVGTAGMQGAVHQATQVVVVQTFQAGVCGFARLTLKINHSHAQSLSRIPAYGQFNFTL